MILKTFVIVFFCCVIAMALSLLVYVVTRKCYMDDYLDERRKRRMEFENRTKEL